MNVVIAYYPPEGFSHQGSNKLPSTKFRGVPQDEAEELVEKFEAYKNEEPKSSAAYSCSYQRGGKNRAMGVDFDKVASISVFEESKRSI